MQPMCQSRKAVNGCSVGTRGPAICHAVVPHRSYWSYQAHEACLIAPERARQNPFGHGADASQDPRVVPAKTDSLDEWLRATLRWISSHIARPPLILRL